MLAFSEQIGLAPGDHGGCLDARNRVSPGQAGGDQLPGGDLLRRVGPPRAELLKQKTP
jgi:hypothetical protein